MSIIDESQSLMKISSTQLPQDRLLELQTSRESMLIYKPENGKVNVYLNLSFKSNLDEKLDKFSTYWYHFYCLLSLAEELNIHKTKFTTELNNLEIFYNELQRTINRDIDAFRRQQSEAQVEMDRLLREEEREVGRRQVEIELTDRLMNLKDKTGYVHVLVETKNKIMEYGKRKGKIEKDLEIARESLECLEYLNANLTNNLIQKNRDAFLMFSQETSRVYDYLEEVSEKDFTIITEPEFMDVQITLEFSTFLCEKINNFKAIYAELMHLVISSYVNFECIEMIRHKWEYYEQCAGFIAARPYVDAELDYYLGKKNKAEFRYDSLFSRDHSKRTEECLKTLVFNSSQLDAEAHNVHISGGVDYRTTTQNHSYSYRDNQGITHSGSVSFSHVSSVSHNLALSSSAAPKHAPDPRNIKFLPKTLEAEKLKDLAKNKYAEVFIVWKEFKAIFDEFEARKQAVIDHKNSIVQRLELLNEDYMKICKNFTRFFKSFETKSFRIDESFNCCMLSLLLKNSNIEKCPGCCGSRLRDVHQTDQITINYIIEFLLKVLKLNKKKIPGGCYNSKIFLVLKCEEIDLDDIRVILLDLRILGSLKNNKNGIQAIKSGARQEEFDKSLFEIISKCIQLACIKKQKNYNINQEKTFAFVMSLQEEGEAILKSHGYDKLIPDYRKFKYSGFTKVS